MIQVDAAKVRAAREAAGLSVQAAARSAKLNYKTVEAYEGHGELRPPANPTLEALVGLARAYGCNPRDFATNPKDWDVLAAEIGAMRATEQIDAMRTLSTDPFRYLVAPRLLAAVLMLPLLTAVADTIGVAGGWLVATRVLEFNPTVYIRNTMNFLENWDIVSGLIKAAVFGFIVALMGCYHGYNAKGGARGVGRATTHAVVSSAILIFASDYLLTTFFTHTS